MKPEIENLKAWIYGKSTTGYQRALGMREFEKLLEYVAELEQLRLFAVVGRSEQLVCPHCKGLEVYIDEYGGKPCKCTKQAN